MQNINSIDEYLFKLINGIGWNDMDPFMILISSKWIWIPLYIFIIFKIYQKFPEQIFKILLSIGALIFLADFGSVHLFKEVFERTRPCHVLDSIRIVDGCGGHYGFISSHASNSFAIAFFISLLFKKRITFILLFSWAVLIGFSRIYLGVHYPFDILGGMFWGLFVSLLTYLIYKMKLLNLDKIWLIWLLLVAIWNFGWPSAPAIADVIVAVILSLLVITFKKRKK
mgnify:CR=1 FL=1